MAHLTWGEWQRIIVGILLAAALIYGGASAIADQRNARDKAICVQVEALKKSMRVIMTRSLTTLPTLQYYRDHPQELQKAVDSTNQALIDFKETKCDSIP